MKKKTLGLAAAAGILILVACLIAYFIQGKINSGDIIVGEPRLPMKADFRMHPFFNIQGNKYGMAIGEEAKVSLAISSDWDGVNTTAALNMPSGLEMLEGGREWSGIVGRNGTTMQVMVRAVKTGMWNVTANVTSSKGKARNTADAAMVLCVDVTREGLKEKCA